MNRMFQFSALIVVLILSTFPVVSQVPTPTQTSTATPSQTGSPALTPSSTSTATESPTVTPTATPTATWAIDSVPPDDFVDYLFTQSVLWGSEYAGQVMGASSFCDAYRKWRQQLPFKLHTQTLGVAGGTVAVTSEALHGTVALEVPTNSLNDDIQVILEKIPNPQTDPLSPTFRLQFQGLDGKKAGKLLIIGSSTWLLTSSYDLSFAKQWTNDLAKDVKIAVRKVGEEAWTLVDTTVDITRGVAKASLKVTEEIIQTGVECAVVITGSFYSAFFQSEGFLTVTTPHGGSSDLHAALHPQAGEKVLILVHGIFSSAETFAQKADDFPESLRAYYDHIIFAQYRTCSQDDIWHLWSPCSSSRAARILWKKLTSQFTDGGDAFTRAEVHLVGHSQGGIVCRWFIEQLPKRYLTYRKLMDKGMIDRFLTLDSPNGGLLDHQFCSWIPLYLTVGAPCAVLNIRAEEILGTVRLNESIDLRGIPTYCIGVKGGIAIPDSSALDLPVSEDHKRLIDNSTHFRVHEEMRTNGVFDAINEWFCLDNQCPTTLQMVTLPPGSFQMGNTGAGRDAEYGWSDEYPRHTVNINYSFQMGKYEVTNAQYADILNWARGRGYLRNSSNQPYNGGDVYHNGQFLFAVVDGSEWWEKAFIKYNGSNFYVEPRNGEPQGNHPVGRVTWYGSVAFCNWLSEKEGRSPAYNLSTWSLTNRQGGGYRLPSESEWEYACRGSSSNPNRYAPFSFGDDLGVTDLRSCQSSSLFNQYMAWCGNDDGWSEAVGSRLPNDYGLYDMHGNVWEWCQDWWHDSYNGAPQDGSAWQVPTTGNRVFRGGNWLNYARYCRSAMRYGFYPDDRFNNVGLRVVLPVSP
ncbi:MAG: hypothetical protein AMXMBFR75_33060 [Candidatus Hinthialibacteria bacterium]